MTAIGSLARFAYWASSRCYSRTWYVSCLERRAPLFDSDHGTDYVIRLILGRRLVNLLPVAQRTNALTNGVVDRPWVVGREFESHVHHENAF